MMFNRACFKKRKSYGFPTKKELLKSLKCGKDAEKNIHELITVIIHCIDEIHKRNLELRIRKDSILSMRQIRCAMNVMESAKGNNIVGMYNEIIDFLSCGKSKITVNEIYLLYIVLCFWKYEML